MVVNLNDLFGGEADVVVKQGDIIMGTISEVDAKPAEANLILPKKYRVYIFIKGVSMPMAFDVIDRAGSEQKLVMLLSNTKSIN